MATAMAKGLASSPWTLGKRMWSLRHPAQLQCLRVLSMGRLFLVAQMTVLDVGKESTQLRKNWLLEG